MTQFWPIGYKGESTGGLWGIFPPSQKRKLYEGKAPFSLPILPGWIQSCDDVIFAAVESIS